jgi:uncharacterized coiled-coil protein SlyX
VDSLQTVTRRLLGEGDMTRVEVVLAFQAEMIAMLADAVAELQETVKNLGQERATATVVPHLAAMADEIVELQRQVAELREREA